MTKVRLTPNQRRIVELIAEGYVRWKIAEMMDVSESTVKEEIRKMCFQLGCRPFQLPERTGLANRE